MPKSVLVAGSWVEARAIKEQRKHHCVRVRATCVLRCWAELGKWIWYCLSACGDEFSGGLHVCPEAQRFVLMMMMISGRGSLWRLVHSCLCNHHVKGSLLPVPVRKPFLGEMWKYMKMGDRDSFIWDLSLYIHTHMMNWLWWTIEFPVDWLAWPLVLCVSSYGLPQIGFLEGSGFCELWSGRFLFSCPFLEI